MKLFRRSHNSMTQNLWQCLCSILGISEGQCEVARAAASLPLDTGRSWFEERGEKQCGGPLGTAGQTTLPMIAGPSPCCGCQDSFTLWKRRPQYRHALVQHSTGSSTQLHEVSGFDVPEWRALVGGLRPPSREPEDHEPGGERAGWQHRSLQSNKSSDSFVRRQCCLACRRRGM